MQLASFEGSTFEDDTDFLEATFESEANFLEVDFRGDASFQEVSFGGEADFGPASFGGEANFFSATFQDGADFYRAQFHGEVDLTNIEFRRWAAFSEASFERGADFGGIAVKGGAAFHAASFGAGASFDGATFDGEADFGWTVFQAGADFSNAVFGDATKFERARFYGELSFVGTTLAKWADFSRSIFEGPTQLGPMIVDMLDLDRAVFTRPVQIEVGGRQISGLRTRFLAGGHARVAWAELIFQEAEFPYPTLISDHSHQFAFAKDAPQKWKDRAPSQPTKSHMKSLERANLSGLVLSGIDLHRCRFSGAHNLDRLRLETTRAFYQSWHIGASRLLLAEECEWRESHYSNSRWKRVAKPDDFSVGDGLVIQPREISSLYRGLRKGREDSKDEPGAADFYYGEMEMRRLDRSTPWAERVILWLYWLVSGYGLRGLRALAWLVTVVVGLAGLLQVIGFNDGDPGFRDTLIYAAQSAISIASSNTALTEHVSWAGEVLRIVLRLAGPVLLGLTLLSIRNRVKR